MEFYLPFLQWIDHQKEHMKGLVTSWANINTHAMNYQGLEEQMTSLKMNFKSLEGSMQELNLPSYTVVNEHGNKTSIRLGKALHITKRSQAPLKIFLGGHMDTVYAKNSSFQQVSEIDENTLRGPGVCDMKGGLVILLTALQALEKSPYANTIGWEVIINPDEEIGSPGSYDILQRAAKRNQLGLVFEPSLPDGSIVTERSGSMNLVIVVRGKAAHAGRDFDKGRNPILAAAALVHDIEELLTSTNDATINIGEFRSGNSFNVVPDLAIIRINIRSHLLATMQTIKTEIEGFINKQKTRDGISIELIDQTIRPPKIVDESTKRIMEWLTICAQELRFPLSYKATRGASDGNILASAGLSTIDSLGAIGGEIHTHNEHIKIDGLVERAKLVALLLMKIGNGEYRLPSSQTIITL